MKLHVYSILYLLAVTGYIDNVTEEKLSRANNSYFDAVIKSSPKEKVKVCVMTQHKSSESIKTFHEYKASKSPVKLTNLSTPGKGCTFLNEQSKISICKNLNFNYDDHAELSIKELKNTVPSGTFTVVGQILWLEPSRTVTVGGSYQKMVRDARFIDVNNDSIDFSIWDESLISKLQHGKTYTF